MKKKNGYLGGYKQFFEPTKIRLPQKMGSDEKGHGRYYPFGLAMAGISDKALKSQYAENKYKANYGSELQNKEFSDGSGLEAYDATFRMYDPQIGRFWQQDPLGELAEGWSPYAFVLDNPISFVDPLGDTATLPPVTVTPLPVHTPNNTPPGIALIGTPPGGIDAPSAPTTPPEINIQTPPEMPPAPVESPTPLEDPVEVPPIIGAPAIILTTVFTVIPITGDTKWPNGDELFYQHYPELKPENRDRDTRKKPLDELWLLRLGEDPESKDKLETDAQRAVSSGFPHGVSARLRPTPPSYGRSAKLLEVMKHFLVLKTGDKLDHYTVVLPNPVTQQVADEFNLVFIKR